ncbi:MAG: hypothetical protein JST75_13900 [Bacteroidetes bacterium]|nr:hypothetical protein [Bacteroidota bacterium]
MLESIVGFPFVIFFANSASAQSASHISKRNFKKLSEQYEVLQKSIKDLEQQKILVEKSLKDYDLKLKTFKDNLEKQEQEYDDALPESDADQKLAATRQADATRMSYNLQYLQLQNQLQNQNAQFAEVGDFMKTKLEAIEKAMKKAR